jgi:cell division protein FtsN
MAKTDGEYELVLGNRQLLSAFFIVVILFALFFTMGYIVGRNSAPSIMASTAAPAQTASARPPATGASAAPAATETTSESPKPVEPADPAFAYDRPLVPPTTHPVTGAPEQAGPEKKTVEKKVAPERKTAAEKKAVVRETPPAPAPIEPRPGQTFLQVVAVAQPQAGAVVDTLKAKGFPARLIPGPNSTIFRVVVGPYSDAATLGKAKAELENAGFHPIMRR